MAGLILFIVCMVMILTFAGFILAAITFAGTPILIFIYVKIIRPKYVSNSDKLYG